ncbi:MAG: hypothetical protein KDA29_14100 [Phycisphaerales bacterium]|nr:hypothetical protein [Phycisphaerales bacterium]
MKLRTMNQLSLGLACASLGVAAITAGPAMGAEPVLELHSVGLYDWPGNEKDEAFMDAFKLLRERMGDLVAELDMEPMQGEMMRLGWDLLTARSSLYIASSDQGLDASFVLAPGNGSTEAMHQQLSGLAMMGGFEFADQGNGISEAMGPMGPMTLGFDEQRLWLAMGESKPASLEIQRYALPKGVAPIMSGRVDINGLIEMFAPGMGAELEAQAGMMPGNPMGMFVGENAVIVEFAAGVDTKQMHVVSRLVGARQAMQLDGDQTNMFTQADFAHVPVDAVRVSAFQTNISATLEGLEQAMMMSGDPTLEEINEELGFDIVNDMLANFGERAIYYQSDTTGGGGLTSAVALVDLRDPDAMGRAHRKLVDRLNELAVDEASGYVRVESRDIGAVEVFSMNFPGLPIPFEPCWAINGGKLVLAVTPTSMEAALIQMSPRASTSIVQNEGFRSAIVSKMPKEGAAMVSYTDTPRMVAKGYGMTNMLTSAIANAARSPEHPDRVRGALLPGYSMFTKDVQFSGGISKWEGDDLVSHYFGDRSMLVQLSAGLGTLSDVQGIIAPAFAAGVMMPALGQARYRANTLKSATQLRTIVQGMVIYGSNNNDQPPATIDVLVEQGIISSDMLVSPMGSAYDGGPDYTVRLTEDAVSSFNWEYIVAIDRAAYVNGNWEVYVGFADAHVEMVDLERLEELLNMPLNKGAREELQLDDF